MNYMFFRQENLPDIKINDFVKVNSQHWLVTMIINPGIESMSLSCHRDGKRKTFSLNEIESVVHQ